MTSLVPIRPRTITIHRVTPEALPKFHTWMQKNDKSDPNSSTNIHTSAGYAESAAQIPQANKIKDKSCLRQQPSTILKVTPEALPKFNMWTQWMASLVQIRPQSSTILQVTLEALPKFHMWTQIMTSLVPIPPQTSTIV